MSTAENVSHLLNLRGADGTALSEVIADYFGGRTGGGKPRYAGADPRGCMGCCSTPPDSSVQILLCINHC